MSEMKQGGGDGSAPDGLPHPGFFRGVCLLCGMKKEDAAASAFCAGRSASGLDAGFKMPTTALVVPRDSPHLQTLLRQRKLTLILDLDHTLLNTTALDDFSPLEAANGFTPNTGDDIGRDLFRLDGHGIPRIAKLRPFVRGFLEQASAMFELQVYTLADPAYARAAVSLLDPAYFGGRVVSRAESARTYAKSLNVIPGAEFGAVVILDDSADVWPDHQGNLILIDRYHYFASSFNFGYNFGSLAEQNRDEGEHDGPLARALQVLKRVHKGFFDLVLGDYFQDVREVIEEVRREVLSGCTVAFSLLNYPEDLARDTPMWTLAVRLGAVCKVGVDETVTHVVVENPGTEKAQWARDNNKFLVNQEWINAASSRCYRQDEQDFPVLPGA